MIPVSWRVSSRILTHRGLFCHKFWLMTLKRWPAIKKLANCCGAGCMLAVHRPDVSENVAVLRIEEAKETGADLLVSGCPRCDETFKKAMAARDIEDIKVVNLVELVAQAVGITK